MERNLNSRYYHYFKEMLKPHPAYEGVRWAVKNSEFTTIVIYEKKVGHIVKKDGVGADVDPKVFSNDGREKFSIFLGYSEDTPDEVKIKGYQELQNIAGELGVLGAGHLTWTPAGADSDAPIPKEIEEQFRKEHPAPDGTIVYTADIYTPVRPELLKLYEAS